MISLLRAFTNRSFALLWSGQIISRLGDSFFTIALAWWVLQKTGSATAMGLVLICSTVPLLVFLLLGGVVGDRWPRVRVMLGSDLIRGGVVLLIAALAFLQWLQLWEVFVMSAIFGTVEAFFDPAYAALIPDMVPAELLTSANALRRISMEGAQLAGPAIAAIIIASGGTSLAFALDGISFFASALCVLALPRVEVLRQPAEMETGILQDLHKGIVTVLASPWLWLTLLIACVSTIFLVGPAEAALPLLIKQRFGVQVGYYALLTTLSALGSLLAAIWLGRFTRLRHRGPMTYGAWLLASLMLMVMGFHIPIVLMSLAFFVQGAAFACLGLAWTNSLQEFVPSDLLGRVSSIDILVSSGLLPIGYGLAGIAADHLGAAPVFLLGGAIAAVIIAVGLLHPAIRAVD
ncbi:MFS transporter [Dictyobacter aurantiacus]|uniref:MFS transporter n=1 Tax=Dictyobacter aurantiacus TaxID=1936993 RepID=A0A401ZNZ5_9CHLR|nr:MFS transporter [Dictyobacter aurantiacus]GCE08530.1 MFS transporter [Dictyobacter aurantiacus]